MYLGTHGWRKREPEELEPELPQWLHRTVLRAFSENLVTKEDAEKMLGEDVEGEQPLSVVGRHAFMKLPLEERRRILREQAAKLKDEYKPDPVRTAWQGGDICE